MFLVFKIDNDGVSHPSFTLSLEGLTTLLSMATPNVCSFQITKIG